MYGVGAKTALITSAFAIIVIFSLLTNWINLGIFPARPALIEGVFEAIEFPLAMLAGAAVYEGGEQMSQYPE